MTLKETVVVEGRDDESAVLAAVSANVITTHGYGIRPETLELIKTAYETWFITATQMECHLSHMD